MKSTKHWLGEKNLQEKVSFRLFYTSFASIPLMNERERSLVTLNFPVRSIEPAPASGRVARLSVAADN
jgi:hypothetical protein